MKKDEPCRVLCSVDLDTKTIHTFIDRIKEDYTVHMYVHCRYLTWAVVILSLSHNGPQPRLFSWVLLFILAPTSTLLIIALFFCRLADNLPAATVFRNLKTNELQYEDGFKLGFVHEKRTVLNNHLTIIIKFHPIARWVWDTRLLKNGQNIENSSPSLSLSLWLRQTDTKYRIVAFEVDPRSVAKESLKLAPSEGEKKPPSKERYEGGDKCVYPSEVSVMELKKKKKGLKTRIRTDINHIHSHT